MDALVAHRKMVFPVLLSPMLGAALFAQTTTLPSTTSSSCDDPMQANSAACSSQQNQTIPGLAGGYSSQGQQSGAFGQTMQAPPQRRTFDRNTPEYVDPAGTQQKNSQSPTGMTFAPDPIVDLQRLARQSTGEMLPIFGRDMFEAAPSTFAPVDQIPVTSDYVIGPGDEVLLRIWGHDAINTRLTVDRSGFIYIPQVGPVHVAGLRFDELEKQLNTEVGGAIKNFHLTANLGQLRSVQIVVVGEARRPGSYTVSALSTVLNALFASGGPNVQGSMRRIEIRRTGAPTVTFDLYDLVLRGDKSKDVRVEAGDVIFIPPVGPQVALAGSVRHPAIYEVTEGSTVGDVLGLAGGLSATAGASSISLDRIDDHRIRNAMNVALDTAGKGMRVVDGDVLYVRPVSGGYEKTVTLRGNLANPERFPWHDGMRLSEIIPDRTSLLTNDYWRERNRLGVPAPLFEPLGPRGGQASPADATSENRTGSVANGMGPASSTMTPQMAAQGANGQTRGGSPELNRSSLADQQAMTNREGTASASRNLIGIPAPEIDWSYAVIERLDEKTLKTSLIPFNLGKLVEDHDASQDLALQPGDVVTILSQADVRVSQDEQTKYVRLEGEIASSGVYSVQPNETLDELVRRAGGLTSKAYLFGASFTRESARVQQQQRLDEYISALALELDRSAAIRTVSSTIPVAAGNQPEAALVNHLRQMRATGRVVLEFLPGSAGVAAIPAIPLEDGDVFRVPSKPVTVSVVGAVYGQNVFLYNHTRNVRDYLNLAGRPNRAADKNRSFVIRADGSILSRDSVKGFWNDAFQNVRLNPGDTIVVPEKPIKPSALRDVIDWSQVFSQFALGAAAVNVIR